MMQKEDPRSGKSRQQVHMDTPTDLRFTRTHEWVRTKGNTIVVGITDYAQQQLPDVTSVELPEPDDHHYETDEDFCMITSINATSDFRVPVSGTIHAINTQLLSNPELVNSDPYRDGWLVEMTPDNMVDVDHLMDIDEYESGLPEEDEE